MQGLPNSHGLHLKMGSGQTIASHPIASCSGICQLLIATWRPAPSEDGCQLPDLCPTLDPSYSGTVKL